MTTPDSSPSDPDTTRSPLGLFRNAEFVALASVRFVSGMSFATILLALALYADLFEASGTIAGLFGSAYAVGRLVFVLPLGRKIDLGNSKHYLLLGLGLNILLLAGLTLVQVIEHVVILRAFQAIGMTILWLAGIAVVGEIAPDGGRGLWIGTYNQIRSISSLCGDLVGGALLFVYGFGTTYTVLIALSTLSLGAVLVFVRDDPGTRADPTEQTGIETFRRLLRRRAIIALVVFRFAFSFGKVAVILFLPIYARTEFGMNALLIGGILAGGKLAKGISQGYVGEVADQNEQYEWFIFGGTVGYAIGTALIPAAVYGSLFLDPVSLTGFGRKITFVPGFFVLFIAYGILGLADSLRLPTSMALFVEEGEYYDAIAGSLSLRVVFWQIGAIVGPLAVGAMFDYVSYFAGFWLAAGFMIFAGIMFLYLYDSEGAPQKTPTSTSTD